MNTEAIESILLQNAEARRRLSTAVSPYELELLEKLANGWTSKALADREGVSEKVIATHLDHALNAMGAHTPEQAVATAIRAGMIDVLLPTEARASRL